MVCACACIMRARAMCVCVCVCARARVYIYIYIYIRTRARAHTHTHIARVMGLHYLRIGWVCEGCACSHASCCMCVCRALLWPLLLVSQTTHAWSASTHILPMPSSLAGVFAHARVWLCLSFACARAPARPRARALLCLVGAGLRLQVCQGDTLGFVRQVLLHASTRARSISRRVLPCSPSTSRCPPLLLSRWEYRHRCVCEGCAQAVGTCPMCRGAKQGVLRVFT